MAGQFGRGAVSFGASAGVLGRGAPLGEVRRRDRVAQPSIISCDDKPHALSRLISSGSRGNRPVRDRGREREGESCQTPFHSLVSFLFLLDYVSPCVILLYNNSRVITVGGKF